MKEFLQLPTYQNGVPVDKNAKLTTRSNGKLTTGKKLGITYLNGVPTDNEAFGKTYLNGIPQTIRNRRRNN